MNRRLLGESGEAIAAAYYERDRYRILARNYRAPTGEIDIVAESKRKVIVFIEVKRRSTDAFGTPAEAVTRAKRQRIAKTAVCFLKEHNLTDREFRFDILEIFGDSISRIESAFESEILF